MRAPVPIRRSMVVNLLAVLTLLAVAIIAAMWLSARRTARELSREVIAQALDRAELELRAFCPVMLIYAIVERARPLADRPTYSRAAASDR